MKKITNKIIIGIAAVVIITFGFFVFSNLRTEPVELPLQENGEVRKLIIVTDPFEPFVYADEDGTAIGITVDVADRIFTKLGVPYEVRIIPWLRVLKELKVGEADAVSPATYTAERAEFLYYTEEEMNYTEGPFPSTFLMRGDVVFFARKVVKDSFPLETFESFEDIRDAGIRVGAIAGWRSTERLYEAGVSVIEYPGIPEQFKALADGKIDIALQQTATGLVTLKKIESGDEIVLLGKVFFTDPMYFSFAKASDYPELLKIRERFSEELQKMRKRGEIEEIYNSYIQ